jgi:hypothetical protein
LVGVPSRSAARVAGRDAVEGAVCANNIGSNMIGNSFRMEAPSIKRVDMTNQQMVIPD